MARKRVQKEIKPKKLTARNIPEREVVKAVFRFLECNTNIKVWRRNTGALKADGKRFIRFGQPGMSDIYGIIRRIRCPKCGKLVGSGVLLEIECKRYGGKLSEAQKSYLATVKKYGGVTLVAVPKPTDEDPLGFRAIERDLHNLDYEYCFKCSKITNREGLKNER